MLFSMEDAVCHRSLITTTTIGLVIPAVVSSPKDIRRAKSSGRGSSEVYQITIPQSLQAEHHEIHEALAEATPAPGRVGAAAKELAAVLDPHFERENQIALPPLGLLAPLAAGEHRPVCRKHSR